MSYYNLVHKSNIMEVYQTYSYKIKQYENVIIWIVYKLYIYIYIW